MSGSSEFLDALPNGSILEEYRLVETLGQGGFGITYRAEDTRLQHFVAIKEYLPVAAAGRFDGQVQPRSGEAGQSFEWGRARFLDEARTLARFRHPNIVRVLRFFEANGTAYLVMDFETGVDLSTHLFNLQRAPTEAELRAILSPLLDGLEVVHRAGFLHRDIKPANILIRADGSPVLLDFGAARHALSAQTRLMTVVMTPGFAPFEQYSETGPQGPWSDLYALGAVMYWAVTGLKPPDAVSRLREDRFVPSADAARGDYSAGFLAAIDFALQIPPEQRPQTVTRWRERLTGSGPAVHPTEPIAGLVATPAMTAPAPEPTEVGPAAPAAPPPAPPPRKMPRRAWLWAGSLALVASAGLIGFSLAPRDGPPGPAPAAPAPVIMAPPPPPAPTPDVPAPPLVAPTAPPMPATAPASATVPAPATAGTPMMVVEPAAIEAALALPVRDRIRIQQALTALGYDTGGIDGTFGPNTRKMIAAYQISRDQPATGFLTEAQVKRLFDEVALPSNRPAPPARTVPSDPGTAGRAGADGLFQEIGRFGRRVFDWF